MTDFDASREPSFGHFAPTGIKAAARRMALGLRRRDGVGRQCVSVLKRIAGATAPDGIYDVAVFGTEKARLRPFDNVCEHRVYAAEQFWDPEERGLIAEAVARHAAERPGEPFVFVDVGANAGLYSLSVHAAARRAGAKLRIIAIEPEPELRRRMAFNFAASGVAGATIVPVAVTEVPGPVTLFTVEGNKGKNSLLGNGGKAVEVPGETLPMILRRADIDRVDALKIDIEGAELPALRGLFQAESEGLWPRLICLETKDQGARDPVALCRSVGYAAVLETRMNAVLQRGGGAV